MQQVLEKCVIVTWAKRMMIWLAVIKKTEKKKKNGFIWSVYLLRKFQKGDGFAQNAKKQKNKRITSWTHVWFIIHWHFFHKPKYL